MNDDTGLHFTPFTGKGRMPDEEADALGVPKVRVETVRGQFVKRRLNAPPAPQRSYEDDVCPTCGAAKIYKGVVPCPDGIAGCLVLHWGYRCDGCGVILQRVGGGADGE